jgi:hypothetical protein
MPQPVTYNPGTPVSGSIQENSISYVVDGQNRNYRGGFGGLSWMSEVPAANNVIFIGNSVSLGRGPANIPLFYPSYNNSAANIIYAANTLPGSPRNFTTTGSAYNWAATNNFFINNSDNPIPRIDADGLALYLDANQPTSYPQTGTTWYDASGFGNNGTLTNGPTWNSNGWFQFDGVDDYITTPLSTTSGQALTVVGILYSTETTTNYRNFYDSVTQKPMIWWDNLGKIEFDAASFTTSAVYRNKWTFVALSKPAGNSSPSYYVNGELVGSGTAYTVPSLTPTWFNRAAAEEWLGNAQSVNFYSRALTTADIKQNYFQSNIVQDGLVFMVDANNLVSYPKSGTSTYSLTGSNVATLFNGVGYNSLNGGSWTFDGVDDYISSTVTGLPTGASARTVNIWVKITGTTGNPYYALCGYGSPNISQTFDLGFNDTTDKVFLDIYGAGGIDSVNTITKNEWHMITGIYTGTQLQLYIDGILEATNNYVINTANSAFEISDTAWGYPAPLVGNVANAQIYNRALSSTEVQQNYQATKDKFLGENIVTSGLTINLDAANKDSYARSLPALEVLVVAGGGGGSGNFYDDGAGGGAGGLIYNSTYQLLSATAITVTVGAGGAASTGGQGGDGGNSVFASLTAIGGGGGAAHRSSGRAGGSGGGSAGAYDVPDTTIGGAGTPGQGFDGGTSVYPGYAGSGGGGAGAPGVGGTGTSGKNGGNGQAYSISGTSTYYAGGGAGYGYTYGGIGGLGGGGNGGNPSPLAPTAGGTNTGGGGGGGRTVGQVPFVGTAAGGSGIVIIRYSGPQAATGGTVVSANGYTTHTFTTSGTFTPALWNDLSGNNINGTLTNGVVWSPSVNGGVMNFDGVDDYTLITPPTTYSEYTIQFFCKWISSVGVSERLFGCDAFGTYTIFNPYDVGFHYNPLGGSPPSVTLASGVNVGFGNWCNVAVTVSTASSNVVIYVNGIARNSWNVLPSANLSANIFVGRQNILYGANCQFGNFQLYNRALSATEIAQNYNATKTRFGL